MSQRASGSNGGVLKALDQFWFGHGSPTALGLFRLFMGTLVFMNLLMIAIDFDAWFTERGYVPAWLGRLWVGADVPIWDPNGPAIPRLNLLNGVADANLTLAFYALITLAAFTTAIGLFTRVSTIVLAVGIVTLHHRNGAILHGGDTVMRVMCLYLALAPCGRAVSVDRLIRLWKGVETTAPIRVSLWAQRLIMYNMALIYFTTTWLKRQGNTWWYPEFIATWYPVRLNEFDRFPYPAFLDGLFMSRVTTVATLVIEFLLGTLVFFRPARKWVLLSGLMLHGWIEYSMNIPLFSYLMVSMYICFYDGEEIQGWFQRLGHRLARFKVVVRLPQGTRLSERGVAFFDAADPLKLITYETGDSPELLPSEVRKSKTRSLAAWPIAWIPGLWRSLLERSLVPAEATAETPPQRKKKGK